MSTYLEHRNTPTLCRAGAYSVHFIFKFSKNSVSKGEFPDKRSLSEAVPNPHKRLDIHLEFHSCFQLLDLAIQKNH